MSEASSYEEVLVKLGEYARERRSHVSISTEPSGGAFKAIIETAGHTITAFSETAGNSVEYREREAITRAIKRLLVLVGVEVKT